MEASVTPTHGAADQTALDEKSVADADLARQLEKALEDLDAAKNAAKEPKEKVKTMKAVVDGLLNTLGADADDVYRVGRFRLTTKLIEGKKVEFETDDRRQTYIKTDKGE